MKLMSAVVLLFLVQSAFAAIIGDVRITGEVVKYDRKTVSLKTLRSSKPVIVPRSSIVLQKGVKLKTGNLAMAVFSVEEIIEKLNQQQEKQQVSDQNQKKK